MAPKIIDCQANFQTTSLWRIAGFFLIHNFCVDLCSFVVQTNILTRQVRIGCDLDLKIIQNQLNYATQIITDHHKNHLANFLIYRKNFQTLRKKLHESLNLRKVREMLITQSKQ
jgi:hypothetical protein